MVGSAIVKQLRSIGEHEVITRERQSLDLLDQSAVLHFFESTKVDQVYLSAAKVGGIYANNSYPADFIYQNLMIQTNIIHGAHQSGVQQLLFLGSSCIYPKLAKQPISETALLTGPVEATNAPYAIAKIAGISLCESYNRQYDRDYRCVMPTNLYGPGDNYHPDNSHVIPGLIARFHQAKIQDAAKVSVWGSGKPKREFLHVDDLASACIHVMAIKKSEWTKNRDPMCSHINIGYGSDISIADLATLVSKIIGFKGEIVFDSSKPDGTPRKILDSSKMLDLGWTPKYTLEDGLVHTYQAYKHELATERSV